MKKVKFYTMNALIGRSPVLIIWTKLGQLVSIGKKSIEIYWAKPKPNHFFLELDLGTEKVQSFVRAPEGKYFWVNWIYGYLRPRYCAYVKWNRPKF